MKRLKILCGSTLSGRSQKMDALWHENRDRALMLLPAASLTRHRLRRWIRKYQLPGVWGSPIWGISEFARFLVNQDRGSARMLSALERRLLVLRLLESFPDTGTGLPPLLPEMLSGLARHLLQVITALKQAAIEPDEFRRRLEHAPFHPCDLLVAQVYDGYQDALKQRCWYDVPGLYWEAEEALRQGRVSLPEGVDSILLDGFDDFTPSQTRFLAALADKAEALCIGLNYDAQDDRPDLYSLQREWINRILASSEALLETCAAPVPQTMTQFAATHLFWRNPPPPPNALHPDLKVTSSIDIQHEVEQIGRKVKTLLVDRKTTPSAIAVAFADEEQVAGVVRAVFREMGIPCVLQSRPPLTESAVGAWLLLFFAAVARWDRDPVVSLITSPLFAPLSASPEALAALPALARQAGIVTGQASWMPALDRLEQAAVRIGEGSRERFNGIVPETLPHLACFRTRLALLGELAASLPDSAPMPRFAALVDALLSRAQIEAGIRRLASPADVQAETNALGALRALLESVADVSDPQRPAPRGIFAQRLRECLRETRYRTEEAFSGAVVCGGLSLLRGQSFDYVFAGGLNEGILPPPESVNALYDESDAQRLRRAGIPMEGQRERSFRERLLFLQALTTARQELTLSYRLQDADGREALPSPFVTDVLELHADFSRVAAPLPLADAFVPDPLQAASPRDLVLAAIHRGDDRLRTAFGDILANPMRIAAIEAQRHDESPFGVYDGVLQDPDIKQEIALQFGVAHTFSANQLERYLQCPFDFFVERVLRLRETTLPDGEINPLTRGVILHEVLERFHARHPQKNVAEILEEDESGAWAVMEECIGGAFSRHAWRLEGTPNILRDLEQTRAKQLMRRYLMAEKIDKNAKNYRPAHLEWSFGAVPDERGASKASPPFTLEIEEETMQVAGKIDRVDRGPDGWRILDYKFGAVPDAGTIKSGLALQLTLYAWVVEALLEGGLPCREACYVPVGKQKYRAALPKKEDERGLLEATARRRILDAARAIRRAEFPPVPDSRWIGRVSASARHEAWRIALKLPEREGGETEDEAEGEEDA